MINDYLPNNSSALSTGILLFILLSILAFGETNPKEVRELLGFLY